MCATRETGRAWLGGGRRGLDIYAFPVPALEVKAPAPGRSALNEAFSTTAGIVILRLKPATFHCRAAGAVVLQQRRRRPDVRTGLLPHRDLANIPSCPGMNIHARIFSAKGNHREMLCNDATLV